MNCHPAFSVALRCHPDFVRRMVKRYEGLCLAAVHAVADAGLSAAGFGVVDLGGGGAASRTATRGKQGFVNQ